MPVSLLLWALAGTMGASLLALIPALHVYNVAAIVLLLIEGGRLPLAPEAMTYLFLGMVAGYAMTNTIPSILLSVPDESMVFVVLPGQAYVQRQRGYEAVVLTGVGGLAGLTTLALLAPVASRWLPALREILQPHLGWILWTVIAYLLLSEWPKGAGRGTTGWRRLREGWASLFAGLATFLLSGLLGLILMYRSPVPVTVAYQGLLPAFVGLFAVPWIVVNLLGRVSLPSQVIPKAIDAPWHVVLHGTLAGVLGGLFAAFFPVVTGGIGGLLGGHATAQRDDRAFIISQGAAKLVTYVGGFLLFFVPGLHLTRGGMAWMVSTQYTAVTPSDYLLATGAALLSGGLAFLLSLPLARLVMAAIARLGIRRISWLTLAILLAVVGGMTGLVGLGICAVATGIGLIPVLWGSRRMNTMGVLLLPIALSMSGAGAWVAGLLGLLQGA
ncbi:MAG: tripartite tricarboxylate transporter permease [Anaerolineae bacterium]|nr:tripartite tricarboxylate transporter permease [Anaerolineae bacterium]